MSLILKSSWPLQASTLFCSPSCFDAKLTSAGITAGDGNVLLYSVDQENYLEKGICNLTKVIL